MLAKNKYILTTMAIIAVCLSVMVGGRVYAQNTGAPVLLNKESVLGVLDGYMQLIRKECRVDIEFPQAVMQYTEIKRGLYSCRDLNFRSLRYLKYKAINPDINCLAQNQLGVNECEIAKRNCKLAAFDLKNFYEKCRAEILSEE